MPADVAATTKSTTTVYESVRCPSCGGVGWVETGAVNDRQMAPGHQCRRCNGSGVAVVSLEVPREA